ncbi:MAG: helix-turn-helix transcriptional regulator [Planctomycetes bacterium]|nr:helix-turn-helix transcriptional regulator [Planctomycetota bacterium]
MTPREREVTALAACRLPDKTIAEALDVRWRTAARHLRSAFPKLGVESREDLPGRLSAGPPSEGPGRH